MAEEQHTDQGNIEPGMNVEATAGDLGENDISPRDAQRDALSTEMASQDRSMLSLLSGNGSEIPRPYVNKRATKDSLKPLH